ncbi:general transcription factor IIF subunit 1 isoform X2 [Orussus abietinus]|uniref:general transcription factor IIF subunit 1 isoform X2 n=1 Tax=Orussus abietinus TaxID=222816 RepID=UPI00062526D9|nr:general transcription factor IIF subunit 1 isoform X2 [Orussus abietinus]
MTMAAPSVQEYSIRVPKSSKKKHNVMRFNATMNVDFSKWSQIKMERENNMKEYKGMDEEMPKFGAGSEFGRDAREEARRKKFGISSRKYKPEDQPWILKSGGKTGKKFKGTREGGVSENAAYYVFTHAADGAIEAFPLHEWYNFQPIQRYKALSAEEAEQEFSRRNKVMNYFSLMLRKRLRNDDDGAEDDPELAEGGIGKRIGKKEKDFKISEMDEWMDSDDDDSDSDNNEEKKPSDEEKEAKQKKSKVAVKKKKPKKKASDDEAFEESDDGDEEGRECDYISESSDSGSELEQQKEIKSVAEEDALRKLLVSDEEDEDQEEQGKKDGEEEKEEDEENKDKDDKDKDKSNKDADRKKDKKKKKKQSKKKDTKKSASGKDSSSDFSSDSESDSDAQKEKDTKKPNSAHSSRSATPTPAAAATAAADPLKRKQTSSPDLSQAKKLKLDNFNLVPVTSYIPGASESGITEDAVRRYLMRKPMTTTELLQKFKSKKTGLTSEQLVNVMTQILKKINPTKQTIKNKMYLSIKAQPN